MLLLLIGILSIVNASPANECLECNSGYSFLKQDDGKKKCTKCDVTNCDKCDNEKATCTKCKAGYFLKDNTCTACPTGFGCLECDTENNAKCSKCPEHDFFGYGYYLDSTDGKCKSCHSSVSTDPLYGCQECSSATVCTECDDEDATLSNGKCIECATGCKKNQCTENGKCNADQCEDGYYYDSETKTCLVCGLSSQTGMTGCSKCSSNSVCTECGAGYYLADSKCTACPTDFYCKECGGDHSKCTACGDNQYLDADDGKCKACASTEEGMAQCTKCTGKNTCTECGYYLTDGFYYSVKDNKCVKCAANCLECSTNGADKCDKCADGYYLDDTDKTCKACASTTEEGMAQCIKCTGKNTCTECQNTATEVYSLNGGKCVKCYEYGCTKCEDSGAGKCDDDGCRIESNWYYDDSKCKICNNEGSIGGDLFCTRCVKDAGYMATILFAFVALIALF